MEEYKQACAQLECPICLEQPQNKHQLPCAHFLCNDCYAQLMLHSNLCPLCRTKIHNTIAYEDKNNDIESANFMETGDEEIYLLVISIYV